MKKILIALLLLLLNYCTDGSQAPFNKNFERANPKKELPFNKLIGTYELDEDSKKRYGINDSLGFFIDIKKDTTFISKNIIDYKDRKTKYGVFKFRAGYINNFKDNQPSLFLNTFTNEFNGNGTIDIYYRKKDSAIALYIFTPMVEATKENNMKYIEGDYLRYIKIKN